MSYATNFLAQIFHTLDMSCSIIFILVLFYSILCSTFEEHVNIRDTRKVLVINKDIPQSAIDLLLSSQFNTVINPHENVTKDEILKLIPGAEAALWNAHLKLDAEILDAAGPQFKMVGAKSAGVDHFDLEEMKKRGVRLSNASPVENDTVANMAILLTLAASRRLHEGRKVIEDGAWTGGFHWMLGQDIRGSTVGIVGFGSIGQAIARKLSVFDVKNILYSGRRDKPEAKALRAQRVSFDDLLKASDFVIVCCPLTPETKGMFNSSAFDKMKSNAVFVNVGRGGIVDQADLIEALKNRKIFAAGLDVTTPEPLPMDHELLTLRNLVVTPHLGSSTLKTKTEMAELAAKNIIRALNGEKLLTPII